MLITTHAILRYQQRVRPCTDAEACELLDTPAVRLAIEIGAPYVRLPGRQRVALRGSTIITVLPSDQRRGKLGRK